MFIKIFKSGYNRDAEQFARGQFLIVAADHNSSSMTPELRAMVRTVYLGQLGHWMMGRLRIGSHKISLSGSYGSDGLPMNLERSLKSKEHADAVFAKMVPLPDELQVAFWNGGGHNTAGPEGPLLKKWALENIDKLRIKFQGEKQDESQS